MLDTHEGWTRRALLERAVKELEQAGVGAGRRNAEWLLQDVLAVSRAQLYAHAEVPVAPAQVTAFERLLVRRCRREPLQYVLGHTAFFGLSIRVTPDVLIPRPETEQVVEAALALVASVPAPRVLDVGTGSGCIALAVQHARPEASVWACDVSRDALQVAQENATRLGLGITFLEADVLADAFSQQAPGALDLIISNPPYIPEQEAPSLAEEVRAHEPALALFAGDDPLTFYHALVCHAPLLLRHGGWLVLETHADYGRAVCGLMQAGGFEEVRLKSDLAGLPRIAIGQGS